jgi:excisionase family DNA binding protein
MPRPYGRPTGGLKISALRAMSLPANGGMLVVAKALGVNRATIQGWIDNHGCPCHRLNGGVYRFSKTALVSWLERTDRLVPVSVVDFTDKVDKLTPEAQEFLRVWAPQVSLSNAFVSHFLDALAKEKKVLLELL